MNRSEIKLLSDSQNTKRGKIGYIPKPHLSESQNLILKKMYDTQIQIMNLHRQISNSDKMLKPESPKQSDNC